eukprot:2439232-Rhodomonas_salina.2
MGRKVSEYNARIVVQFDEFGHVTQYKLCISKPVPGQTLYQQPRLCISKPDFRVHFGLVSVLAFHFQTCSPHSPSPTRATRPPAAPPP